MPTTKVPRLASDGAPPPRAADKFPLPPVALFSFLKETKGINRWSSRDLAKTLNLRPSVVKQALEPRNPVAYHPHWANERERQKAFLKQLRGKTPLLKLHPYAEWMSHIDS